MADEKPKRKSRGEEMYDHPRSQKERAERKGEAPKGDEGEKAAGDKESPLRRAEEVEPKSEAKPAGGGDAMRGGHRAEREAMHHRHEAERRDLHGKHRAEHRAMDTDHEAEHKGVSEHHALVALHRHHEDAKHKLAHSHHAEHMAMAGRHHEERLALHRKHEAEMLNAGQAVEPEAKAA